MPARHPSREERALWHAAMRDVRPRRGAPAIAAPSMAVADAAAAPSRPVAAPTPAAPGPGLDRRSAQRLKRGQMAIEARLDLHGMTQAEAHDALQRFIARAQEGGRRAVLIVTGKGGRDGAGVLRRAVPRWLAEAGCRARVLAVEEARPMHGGAGALYVLLRRKR
jgi:DNA-nicking Smr family endonuclease